jgi:hypothetical protein
MRTAYHFKFTFRIVLYRTYSCPLDQQAGVSTAQRFDGLGCGIQFAKSCSGDDFDNDDRHPVWQDSETGYKTGVSPAVRRNQFMKG